MRPRDRRIDSLLGAAPGQAIYHLVEGFHGLSTTVEANAQAAQKEFNKPVKSFPVPVTTLRALCREHAPREIDFLKIDVEGAEQAVLEGNDWARFRPKVIVAEAVAPITLAPAWEDWEPILIANGYRFAFSDGLNRYYADEDQPAVGAALAGKPPSFKRVPQYRRVRPSARGRRAPRSPPRLAAQGRRHGPAAAAWRQPRMSNCSPAALPPAELDRPATAADAAAIAQRLFGDSQTRVVPELHRNATIRDLYEALVATEQFRAACGRISASYAW